ncbi:MAG TPA: hypothetical protein VF145_07125 [Chitinophagaceae bacterium]
MEEDTEEKIRQLSDRLERHFIGAMVLIVIGLILSIISVVLLLNR